MKENKNTTPTQNLPQKHIDYRFKLLYAIGMIFIVAGHCNNGGISLLYDWFHVYGFHLGLFIFCSGYFYSEKSEKDIPKYIVKKIKSLLIPLFIWNIFYGLIVSVSHNFGFTIGGEFNLHNIFIAPLIDGHQFGYNLSGWFVIPLFFTEILNVIFRKVASFFSHPIKEYIIFFTYLAIGLFGIYLSNKGYNVNWWLALTRTMVFFPFFGAGIFYKKTLEKHDKLPNILYFSIILAIQLLLILLYGAPLSYTMSWGVYDGFVRPFIIGYLGIAFWLRVCKILEPILGRNKYVNLIADNTYSIMINHFAGFMIIKLIYALFSKFTSLFANFNIVAFKTDLWYYYTPRNIEQTLILYLIAGIVFPIIVQKLLTLIKNKILTLKSKKS